MNEENGTPQPRKRSLFRILLPYIAIIATIGIFVAVIVKISSGKPTVWNSDVASLDKALEENTIKTAEVINKDTTVTISGKYVVDATGDEKEYTVTMDASIYKNEFNYYPDPTITEHI